MASEIFPSEVNTIEKTEVNCSNDGRELVEGTPSSDEDHYSRNFPRKNVGFLVLILFGLSFVSCATQIALLTHIDEKKRSKTVIESSAGIWSGLFACLAACMTFLAAMKPTQCTLLTCLTATSFSSLVSLAFMSLATYGIALANSEEWQNNLKDIHFSIHPQIFNGMAIKSFGSREEDLNTNLEHVQQVQSICFAVQILLGLGQVIVGAVISALACRTLKNPLQRPNQTCRTVLFSTRTEAEQRDTSSPHPGGLESTSTNSTKELPPKYEEIPMHIETP